MGNDKLWQMQREKTINDMIEKYNNQNEEPIGVLAHREDIRALKGNYAAVSNMHRNRLQQLRSSVYEKKMDDMRVAQMANMFATIESEDFKPMDSQAESEALENAKSAELRSKIRNCMDDIEMHMHDKNDVHYIVSAEEFQARRMMMYRAYTDLHNEFSYYAKSMEDMELLRNYERKLANFAGKHALDEDEAYQDTEQLSDLSKSIRSVDSMLVRAYSSGENFENIALIQNIMERPENERLFIYALIENGITEDLDFLDIIKFTTDYVPDPAKILDRVTPNGLFRAFGKNLYTKKIMKAIRLCDQNKNELEFVDKVRDIADDATVTNEELNKRIENKGDNADDAIIQLRSRHLNNTMRYLAELKGLEDKKENKKRIEEIKEKIVDAVTEMVRLDNLLPETEDKVGVKKQYEHATTLGDKAKKVGIKLINATPKAISLGNMGFSTVKTSLTLLASPGAAVGNVVKDMEAGVTSKWHLPADTVKYLNQHGHGDAVANMGNIADSLKDVLAGLTVVGNVLSAAILVASSYGYIKGFFKMTTADKILGAAELGNNAISFSNATASSCKALGTGSAAAAGTVAGSLSIVTGTASMGIGVYQLAENHFIRKKKRDAAAEGLKRENQQALTRMVNEGTAEDQILQHIKDKEKFDSCMLKLSEKMSERRDSSAANKMILGGLTVAAGAFLLVNAPVFAAVLGAGALFTGIKGFVSDLRAKKRNQNYIVDEYLGINKIIEGNDEFSNMAEEQLEETRTAMRRELIQSQGFSNSKAFYSAIMRSYAIEIHDKIFNNRMADSKIYEDLVRSIGVRVDMSRGYPTVEMIHSKMMA